MNERIKELALQAGGSHYPEVNSKTLEKFAELIVRECADVITETHWHLPPTQEQVALSIKEHFGVEE